MSNDDPFTLDLFNTTTLSSGLGLGVTAFGNDFGAGEPKTKETPTPAVPEPQPASPPVHSPRRAAGLGGDDFVLQTDRGLGRGWKQRARDNLDAMRLAAEIESADRPATREEQARLIRFTGFGASELANAMFRRPGDDGFRPGWDAMGAELEEMVSSTDYASLARCTQYAHFTPEFIVRAMWAGLVRLGWRGGRVLEPGIGTGLFVALMPAKLRDQVHVTGVELDPVTVRIARLLQPPARILNADFARTDLPAGFDLAIGNPPFSNRIVRSDRAYRSMGLRLHDYFIARSIDLLKPGGLAAFVTSSGTMDKTDCSVREHIGKTADLVAAIRLPEGSFRADAGTDVVVDVLFFRKRGHGEAEGDLSWLDTDEVRPAHGDDGGGKQAIEWVLRVARNCPEALYSNDGQQILSWVAELDIEGFAQLIKVYLINKDPLARGFGALAIFRRCLDDRDWLSFAENLIEADAEYRSAAAAVAAANFESARSGTTCTDWLIRFFDDDETAVRQEAFDCFRRMKTEDISAHAEVFKAYAASKYFESERTYFLHRLEHAPPGLDDLVLNLLEETVRKRNDSGRDPRAYELHEIGELALKIYASNSEHPIRRTCALGLIDQLVERGLMGIQKLEAV